MQTINLPHQFNPATRPYQLDVLRNPARFKSLLIHRKAGKTALALNELIRQTQLAPGKVFWYVAPFYQQAKEIIWRDPDMLAKYLPDGIVARKNESELAVYFKNGSVLALKGADKPDSLRGPNPRFTVLDEFPTMKPMVWDEIISPIVLSNAEASVWFVGTPKPQGEHAKRIHEAAQTKPGWFALTLNAEQSGILTPDMLAAAKATMTQAGYEQEFLCRWHDKGGVVFRGLDKCLLDEEYEDRKYDQRCKYQFGIDLAMLVDWTVAVGINRVTMRVDVFDRYNQVDYNLQKARIEAMLRRYGNSRANVDSTGVGLPIVQDLQAKGLNVEGVHFTESMKRDLITNLAITIEQGKIKFPRIPELLHELNVFGYEVSNSGRVRYGAPSGEHDDCVLALALAVWDIGSRLSAAEAGAATGHKTSSKLSFK